MNKLNQYQIVFILVILISSFNLFGQEKNVNKLSGDEKELLLRYRQNKSKQDYYSISTDRAKKDTSDRRLTGFNVFNIGNEVIYEEREGIIVKYDKIERSYLIYFADEDDTQWIDEEDENLEGKFEVGSSEWEDQMKGIKEAKRIRKKETEIIDTIYGKQFFRGQNLRVYKKASEEIIPDSYVLGPGDEITISVWGYSEFDKTFEISPKGFINSEYTGRIHLKGLTFINAKKVLKSRFGKVFDLKRSGFDVLLSYSRTISVNIVGEVTRPGTYEIPAVNTAFNALMAAKGIGEIGSIRRILIVRDDKIIDSLDVYQFLIDPLKHTQVYLQDKDYIFVPVREKLVKVKGEVKRPMYYEIKKDETISDLIRYAGGFSPKANRNRVSVVGFKENMKLISDIDLTNKSEIDKFRFNDGDEVTLFPVLDRVDNAVTIEGAVNVPGDFEFQSKMRISDLIKKSQGFREEAYLLRANLYREVSDFSDTLIEINLLNITLDDDPINDMLLQPRDRLIVLSRKDFVDSLSVVVHGAVRKPDTFVYGKGMTLKDALLLSGGLIDNISSNNIEISRIFESKDESQNKQLEKVLIKTVTVDDVFGKDNAAANFKLKPFDQIFVRAKVDFEFQRNVGIYGEVMYPGFYSLSRSDERITDLIERAGGLTQVAFQDGCNLYRNHDSTGFVSVNLRKALKDKASRSNLILKQGDSIFITKETGLVRIQGKLRNTLYEDISVPFNKKRNAKYYVNKFAGGYIEKKDKELTFVVLPNQGIRGTRKLFFCRRYPKVVPGSTIVVPKDDDEVKEFVVLFKSDTQTDEEKMDWNKIVGSTMATLASIFSVILLIDNLNK